MYVHPILVGVIGTILVEAIALITIGTISYVRGAKKGEKK